MSPSHRTRIELRPLKVPVSEISRLKGFWTEQMLLMERSICFLIHADFAQEFQGEMKIAAVLPSAPDGIFSEPLLQIVYGFFMIIIKINTDESSYMNHSLKLILLSEHNL